MLALVAGFRVLPIFQRAGGPISPLTLIQNTTDIDQGRRRFSLRGAKSRNAFSIPQAQRNTFSVIDVI
jgi:hypothetical protein